MIVTLIFSSFQINAQEKITLSFSNISLEEAIRQIEAAGRYTFFYDVNQTDLKQKVSLQAKDESLEKAIQSMLSSTNLTFEIEGRQIALINKQTTIAPGSRSKKSPG
ncbi:MAG: STN domain-containing protein [Tannerellaceae bacterium]|nr:STN domain-containing protein [Tannerellaceae bacterium]